jgi:hypothetical protein
LRLRSLAPAAAVALVALLLVVPTASAAPQIPTLVSTPQYKSFNELVNKLRGEQGKPTTQAEKASHTAQLTGKHGAVVNRANSLFTRGKQVAKQETSASFRKNAKRLRKSEATELAQLRAATDTRLDRARDSYQRNVGALEDEFDELFVRLQKQLSSLRMQKAKADGAVRKGQIQNRIEDLGERLAAARKEERKEDSSLRERYAKERQKIQALRSEQSKQIQRENDEALETLRSRWNRAYNGKVTNLQNRRTTQIAELEAKLNAGRAAIASMPVAG